MRAVSVALSLSLVACATSPAPSPVPVAAPASSAARVGGFSRALPLLVQAERAAGDRPADALPLYEQAIPYDVRSLHVFLRVAIAAARVGAVDDAFRQLDALSAAGFARPGTLLVSNDLKPLHGDPRWDRVLAGARVAARAASDPDRSRLVVQDLDHFWRAYDLAKGAGDPKAIYAREYVDPASPELQGFFTTRIGTVDDLVETVESNRPYYDSIRPPTARVRELQPRLREVFHHLHDLLPDAVFPDVAFVVGRFQAAGISTPDGLVIAAELACSAPDSPVAGFPQNLRDNLKGVDDLPYLVAHEVAHFQQHFGPDSSTLAAVLREGGAELVAELASGRVANPAIAAYGQAHEAELWRDFQADMGSTDEAIVTRWVWGGTPVGNRPRDLGYYVGYRITRAYYERQTDKRAALRALLDVQDARGFLAASGYSPG
jgi:hypothetical protein